MKIGELRQMDKDEIGEFEGTIQTLALDTTFELKPAQPRPNSYDPSHLIMVKGKSGHLVRIGSAWIRTAKRGENPGSKFLSLNFDDPSLPNSINVAAFRSGDTLIWDVLFRRRQVTKAA